MTNDTDTSTEVTDVPEITDEQLHALFPNPAGYAVARMTLDAHNEYCDAHAATFPDETNVRENAWRKQYTEVATEAMTTPLVGPFAEVDTIARTSEDPEEVAYVIAFAEHILKEAKANLHGLYLATKATRNVPTNALPIEQLETLLAKAETNVGVLLSLTTNGCATEEAVWSILPSTERQRRNGSKGDTITKYAPPRIKRDSVRLFRENSSVLKLQRQLANGDWMTYDETVGAAVKARVSLTMSEIRDKYFDGTFTNDSLRTPFFHQGETWRFTTDED